MQAIRRRSWWAPLATIVVAVGVHGAIIAALPKGRPSLSTLSPPMVAADVAPHVFAPQFQANAPPVVAPDAPLAPVARAPKVTQAARTAVKPASAGARRAAPARDENATIDMRSHEKNDEPILIATPLPVTTVLPPSPTR
jgi:hypothetical protein